MIIDSGATSHFISENMNIPKGGKSDKQVYLPDNTTLRTLTKTKLPFSRLSEAAQEADVLPGLKRSLMSVNKMSDKGCTKIFHPREEGVTIHQEGTISITMTEPPVLFGRKLNGEKLWTFPARSQKHKPEEVNNAYSLPSIPQSIKYLHAAEGFPVKETWTTAIQAGNYVTWPGLMATTIRKHFPDSDETQKGHMKKQRQGVRSTRIRDNTTHKTSHKDHPQRKCEMYSLKSTMPQRQCTATKLAASQQHPAGVTNISWC
jgi:hypothetical protein